MYIFFFNIIFFNIYWSLFYYNFFNIIVQKNFIFIKTVFSDFNDINITQKNEFINNKDKKFYENIYFVSDKIKYSINKFFNIFEYEKIFISNKNWNTSFFTEKNFIIDKIFYNWNNFNSYYCDYQIFITMFIISFFLSFLIFILSNFIGNSTTLYFERAKLSVYECGFQPFERIDKCQIFIFYRLAIFFVIFEAELIFLYPWVLNVCELSTHSIEYFYNAFFFIFILFFGFFYEIKNKALDF